MAYLSDRPQPVFVDFPQPDDLAGGFSAAVQRVLDRINQKVADGNSLEEILRFLFHEVQPIIACDRIGLAFLDEDGNRVVAHLAVANYEPLHVPQGYAADLHGSSLEKVLLSGLPRVIGDLALYARAHPSSDSTKRLLREGIRSSMTCPLVVAGRSLGFLFFSARRPNAYSDREVSLELQVAERLAQAVEKAYRMDQLESSRKAYLELLGFASHELKNPLASIISEGKVLTGGYLGAMEPRQSALVGKMVRKAEFLLELVRQYLDLARLEEGRLHVNPRSEVNLIDEIVLPSIDLVLPLIEEKGMVLEHRFPEGKPAVECDPALLSIVLVNLLGNAAKYGNEGGRIDLVIEVGPTLKASVTNEGPGFTEHDKNLLFRKFSRLLNPELAGRKGSGVGLYTSWWIVNHHGGKIWADSEPGRWARFTFEIPQPIPGRQDDGQTEAPHDNGKGGGLR